MTSHVRALAKIGNVFSRCSPRHHPIHGALYSNLCRIDHLDCPFILVLPPASSFVAAAQNIPARMQDSQSSKHSSLPAPSLALNDISFSLSSSQHQLVLSPLPRVPLPPQRTGHKPSRPSTASSIIHRRPGLLPSTPSLGSYSESSSPLSSPRSGLVPSWPNVDSDLNGSKADVKHKMPKQSGPNSGDDSDLCDNSRHRSILGRSFEVSSLGFLTLMLSLPRDFSKIRYPPFLTHHHLWRVIFQHRLSHKTKRRL